MVYIIVVLRSRRSAAVDYCTLSLVFDYGMNAGDLAYLYNDGEFWHFMDQTSFEQKQADETAVRDAKQWLKEEDICEVTLYNGEPLSVSPPNFVELEIIETDPGLKGDTAGTGGKPATLSTGAVVRVPLFVQTGEIVKVDTRTGDYVGRIKQ